MGLQKGTKELGCGVDGWYNAYNLTTFVNAGRDSEKASEIAGENISERLSEFKSKPLEFVDFAKNKITTQWCEPTFQTFWMLQAMDNHAEWSKVAKSIEKGKANKIIFVFPHDNEQTRQKIHPLRAYVMDCDGMSKAQQNGSAETTDEENENEQRPTMRR